jgi:hypothetical protein
MKRDPEHVLSDETLSRALRGLPRRNPPPNLAGSLRVIASREHRRRVYGRGAALADRLHLFFNNLMRPLALPFAGGVFSTVALFSMCLIPMYPVRGSGAFDVPTGLTTEVALDKTAPIAADTGDVIVDVTVDALGRMVDYKIVSGNTARDESLRRSIEGTLLRTTFIPATALGQPVEGRMRLSLCTIHIDVKG